MGLKEYKSKRECINHIRKNDVELAEFDNDKLENMIFKHHNTFALTAYGKFQLSKYYEHYIMPFQSSSLKEKVMLNRVIDTPYHYSTRSDELTLFDNELSFFIKLCGGVSPWLLQESSMKAK